MSTWVLTRGYNGTALYFRGESYDGPLWTVWAHDAYKFSSARAAYECANTHTGLRDSSEVRAVELKPKCERTS